MTRIIEPHLPSQATQRTALSIAVAILLAIVLPSAEAAVSFLGVAAGDATNEDVTLWTRAKDEANPQPTAIKVQISTNPTFGAGVTTLLSGTANSTTDYTVKANVGGLEPGTVYYYRFLTLDGTVTSNVGKFKTAPDANAHVPVHFAVSGDCDGLIARMHSPASCRRRTSTSSCSMATRNTKPLRALGLLPSPAPGIFRTLPALRRQRPRRSCLLIFRGSIASNFSR
jgi:hypothetical protein